MWSGVEWSGADAGGDGVHVDPRTLKSVSAHHVYAAGDCCNAVTARLRTASQAAWTGFYAVRNMKLPIFCFVGGWYRYRRWVDILVIVVGQRQHSARHLHRVRVKLSHCFDRWMIRWCQVHRGADI